MTLGARTILDEGKRIIGQTWTFKKKGSAEKFYRLLLNLARREKATWHPELNKTGLRVRVSGEGYGSGKITPIDQATFNKIDNLAAAHHGKRDKTVYEDENLDEVSPPGFSGTTKAMKDRHPEIDNPYALAWSMYKKGAKPRIKPEAKSKGVKKYISPEKYAARNADVENTRDQIAEAITSKTAKAVMGVLKNKAKTGVWTSSEMISKALGHKLDQKALRDTLGALVKKKLVQKTRLSGNAAHDWSYKLNEHMKESIMLGPDPFTEGTTSASMGPNMSLGSAFLQRPKALFSINKWEETAEAQKAINADPWIGVDIEHNSGYTLDQILNMTDDGDQPQEALAEGLEGRGKEGTPLAKKLKGKGKAITSPAEDPPGDFDTASGGTATGDTSVRGRLKEGKTRKQKSIENKARFAKLSPKAKAATKGNAPFHPEAGQESVRVGASVLRENSGRGGSARLGASALRSPN